MGIDYIIHYECAPKEALTLAGLMGRLKGRDRARAIIDLYREEGDQRAPAEMGFEMVRRLPDGSEEVEIVVVQDLLDAAAELTPWESHCTGCPANVMGTPFGCIGTINYPISAHAERWLLDQLPENEHPLLFTLIQAMIREMTIDGASAAQLRTSDGIIFESEHVPTRRIGHVEINGNQVFEMLFLTGPIHPAHGALMLQFFGGISQDLDADQMVQLSNPPSAAWIDAHIPYLHEPDTGDDGTILTLKEFFRAVHRAYKLGVSVLLDV